MSNQKVANIQNALSGAGYVTSTPAAGTPWALNGPYNMGQIEELVSIFRAGGAQMKMQKADTLPSITLTPAATTTGNLVITQTARSFANGEFITVSVGDAAGDTLACAVTGAGTSASPWLIAITLANSTDSKNTLLLIAAIINATVGAGANTGTTTMATNTSIVSCAIYGTSSPATAQLVHGGTNTLAATLLTDPTGVTYPGAILLSDLT